MKKNEGRQEGSSIFCCDGYMYSKNVLRRSKKKQILKQEKRTSLKYQLSHRKIIQTKISTPKMLIYVLLQKKSLIMKKLRAKKFPPIASKEQSWSFWYFVEKPDLATSDANIILQNIRVQQQRIHTRISGRDCFIFFE